MYHHMYHQAPSHENPKVIMDSHYLSNIRKLGKKTSTILVTNFVELLFDENLGKDVLFSEVLFLQQTSHFCLVNVETSDSTGSVRG